MSNLQHISRSKFAKFRLRAHRFKVESGRFSNNVWIPAHERVCEKCSSGEPENEYHILMTCDFFKDERNELFSNIGDICPAFTYSHDWDQFLFLMSYGYGDSEICNAVSAFIDKVV